MAEREHRYEQSEFTRTAIANVRQMRQERELSVRELVEELRQRGSTLTHAVITNLENSRRADLTVTEAMDLADLFAVSLEWLVTSHGPKCSWCKDEPPMGYQCTTCRAVGTPPPCELCNGSGRVMEGEHHDMEATCPFCAGTGTQAVKTDA